MGDQILNLSAIGMAVLILVFVLVASRLAKRPPKMNQEYYQQQWKDLQKHLIDQATWPLAIIDADKLVDHALKGRKYKGKTMGERLVSAQHAIQGNDEVWFGHKLRNRLVHEHDVKLREKDVKQALLGMKHALKDLGAL